MCAINIPFSTAKRLNTLKMPDFLFCLFVFKLIVLLVQIYGVQYGNLIEV